MSKYIVSMSNKVTRWNQYHARYHEVIPWQQIRKQGTVYAQKNHNQAVSLYFDAASFLSLLPVSFTTIKIKFEQDDTSEQQWSYLPV